MDYRDYERKVGKLLDTHIRSNDVTVVTPQVNIFDVEAFDAAVAQLATPAAQADTIAHQAQRTTGVGVSFIISPEASARRA